MELPPPPDEINNPPAYDDFVVERSCNIEMVGLFGSSNGRGCERHECCGKHVRLGDLVQLKRTVFSVSRGGTVMDEEAIETVMRVVPLGSILVCRFMHQKLFVASTNCATCLNFMIYRRTAISDQLL
jgi:hypothetical protein